MRAHNCRNADAVDDADRKLAERGAMDRLALAQMLTASVKTMPMPVTRTANAVRSYSGQVQY